MLKAHSSSWGSKLNLVLLLAGGTFIIAAVSSAVLSQSWGVNKIVVLTTGIFFILGYCRLIKVIKGNLIAYTSIAFFSYLAFEVCLSAAYFTNLLEPPSYYSSVWIFEDTGRTVQFDRIRGYRLTSIPSRWARLTKGTFEYIGVLKGNNQGFPDKDDFYPKRISRNDKRIAVFGDSFTAGQYLMMNWPDRAEQLAQNRQGSIQLLNFSIDGGGLANWWSVLTKIVEAEHYDLDGIVFAVYPGDLRRKFTVSDHRGEKVHVRGRISTWDPASFPTTVEEARPAFERHYGSHIVSTEEFDRFLKNEWKPSPRDEGRLRFYFAWLVWNAIEEKVKPQEPALTFQGFEEDRKWYMTDIKRAASVLGVPILVVHVPSRPELLEQKTNPLEQETRAFADELSATFIDGKLAFGGYTNEEIKQMWLPYDAHWGQKGSDRFAEYVIDIVEKWPTSTEGQLARVSFLGMEGHMQRAQGVGPQTVKSD